MINATFRVVLEHLKNEILDDCQSSWNFEAVRIPREIKPIVIDEWNSEVQKQCVPERQV